MIASHTTDKMCKFQEICETQSSKRNNKPQWETNVDSRIDKFEWAPKVWSDARKTNNINAKVERGWDDLSRRNPNKEYVHIVTKGRGAIQKHATHCKNHV
jgi:hypothetical protein